METYDLCLRKSAYRVGLTRCFNDALLQHFSQGDCKEELVLTDCGLNQKRGIAFYQFMVPVALFKKWSSSLSVQVNAKELIVAAFERVKRSALSWKIGINEVQIYDNSVFFQICIKSLVKILMQCFVEQNDLLLKDVSNMHISPENNQKNVVLCYLHDTSAVRTLLLASLLFDKTFIFLRVSKCSLKYDINSLLKVMKLKFHFEYPLSNPSNKMDVFAKSSYFQTEVQDGTCRSFIFFEEKCLEQYANSHPCFSSIMSSKLYLSTAVLNSICDMEVVLLSFHTKGVLDNLKIYHIGTNYDKLFAKQLCIAFLIYTDLSNKNLLLTAGQLFANDNHLFHGPVETALKATELLDFYKQKLSESFASRDVKYKNKDAVVDAMVPSVLKLDFLSISISSSVKKYFDSGSCTSANFVMYNYCRLSNLLKIYSDKVENGFYPSLPNLEDVDFSLLQEKSELLLINQIWKFGDIKHSMSDFSLKSFKPHLAIIYIQQLCSIFSKFYNRFHVLGANYKHLLPLMQARIYLLKAIKCVLEIVFSFFKIVPLEYM